MNIHLRRVAIGLTVAAAFAGVVLWVGIDGDDEPAPPPAAATKAVAASATVDVGDGYELASRSWSDGPVQNDEPEPEAESFPLNEATQRDREFAEKAAKRWQNLEIAVGR